MLVPCCVIDDLIRHDFDILIECHNRNNVHREDQYESHDHDGYCHRVSILGFGDAVFPVTVQADSQGISQVYWK